MGVGLNQLRREIRNQLTNSWLTYYPFAALTEGGTGKELVTNKTDLTIEGFPRSANSFLEAAINRSAAQQLRISHHVHSRANVYRSIKLKVPTVVLFRNPVDAVVSYLEECDGAYKNPILLFREYNIFYNKMPFSNPYLKYVSFEDVVKNTSKTVESILNFASIKIDRDQDLEKSQNEIMCTVSNLAMQRVGFKPAYNRENSNSVARKDSREKIRNKVLSVCENNEFKMSIQKFRELCIFSQ